MYIHTGRNKGLEKNSPVPVLARAATKADTPKSKGPKADDGGEARESTPKPEVDNQGSPCQETPARAGNSRGGRILFQ
jgi:hypothetical protein